MIVEILLLAAAFCLLIFLGVIGWGIGTYNTFRVGQQDIKTQWGNVKTEYQRRADLLYNLAQAVKSHKKFEKETLTKVIAMRNGNFGSNKLEELKNMKNLDNIFSKLMLLVEAYPNLKSNEQHNKLMDEVRITEDRVNVARTDYNEIVGDYNKVVMTFPSNLIAGMYKFLEQPFFECEKSAETAPKLNLD